MKLTRLREVRELRGWSQSKLAEEAGVSRDGISNYETGHREAWPATAKKVADALGVEISDLVTRAEEPAFAGKAEAPETGRLPEWASTSDIEVLGRNTSEETSEELRRVLMQQAQNLPWGRTLEDARNESHSESIARVLSHARIDAIVRELRRRGEKPPEESLIAFRKWLRAMSISDAESDRDADRETSEAG